MASERRIVDGPVSVPWSFAVIVSGSIMIALGANWLYEYLFGDNPEFSVLAACVLVLGSFLVGIGYIGLLWTVILVNENRIHYKSRYGRKFTVAWDEVEAIEIVDDSNNPRLFDGFVLGAKTNATMRVYGKDGSLKLSLETPREMHIERFTELLSLIDEVSAERGLKVLRSVKAPENPFVSTAPYKTE